CWNSLYAGAWNWNFTQKTNDKMQSAKGIVSTSIFGTGSIGALISSLMSLRNFFSKDKVADDECDDKTAEDSIKNEDDNKLEEIIQFIKGLIIIIFLCFSGLCLWGIVATFFCFEYIIPLIEDKNKNGSEDKSKNKDGNGSEDKSKNKDGNGSEDKSKNKDGNGSEDKSKNKDGNGSEDKSKNKDGNDSGEFHLTLELDDIVKRAGKNFKQPLKILIQIFLWITFFNISFIGLISQEDDKACLLRITINKQEKNKVDAILFGLSAEHHNKKHEPKKHN
ncbi:33822_t:CDS:2, partial [Racocetra persica]